MSKSTQNNWRYLLMLILALFVLMMGSAFVSPSGVPVKKTKDPVLDPTMLHWGARKIQFADGFENQSPEIQDLDQQAQGDEYNWVKFAYQYYNYYETVGWDIFTNQGLFSEAAEENKYLTHLTATKDDDYYPRISPSGTLVAFTRDNGADQNIFMGSWGYPGYAQQLTFDPATDTLPNWSPDGTKLVFVSDRYGDAEILVMNASDGSNIVRLTQLTGDDVDPVWSPDGKYIAWLHIVEDSSEIWLMNADGSDPKKITSGLLYGENLAWSPDGSTLGFDYAPEGSIFTRLASVKVDGSDLGFIGPGTNDPIADEWMIGWTPDGQHLFYRFVQYILDDTDYYISNLMTRAWDLEYATFNTVHNTYGLYYSLNLNIMSLDKVPPSSTLGPIDQYLQSNKAYTYPIYSTDNNGGSGIDTVYIECRNVTNDVGWEQCGTVSSDGKRWELHAYRAGLEYEFRSRVTDNAQNRQPVATTIERTTSFYDQIQKGTIVDNRGVSIPLVNLVSGEQTVNTPSVDLNGNFIQYLVELSNASMVFSKDGYGSITDAINISSDNDVIEKDWYLPPQDNLVEAGSFDTDLSGSWNTDVNQGVYVVEDPQISHTGRVSAELVPDQNIYRFQLLDDHGGGYSKFSPITDPNGDIHIVYSSLSDSSNLYSVYYLERTTLGTWSSPELISSDNATGNGLDPDINRGSDGVFHVVWLERTASIGPYQTKIMYSERATDGTWSTPIKLADCESTLSTIDNLKIFSNSSGAVQAVWNENGYGHKISRLPGKSWGAVEDDNLFNSLLSTPDGTLHKTWLTISGNLSSLNYSSRTIEGDWTTPIIIYQGVYNEILGYYIQNSLIGMNQNGDLYEILYDPNPDDPGTRILKKTSATGWSEITKDPIQFYGKIINLLIGNDDTVTVIAVSVDKGVEKSTCTTSGCSSIQHYSSSSTVFTDIEAVGNGDGTPILVGYQYHIGHKNMVDRDLGYSDFPDSTEQGVIQQEISIPMDMHNPTLTFLEKGINVINPITLHVSINGTEVMTQAPTSSWNQYWLDVSPWLGQTIDLRFYQDDDGQSGNILLDDISLGSWVTPQIMSMTPTCITDPELSGQQIALTGANFTEPVSVFFGDYAAGGVTVVDEGTIIVDLPADLPLGNYRLRVVNQFGVDYYTREFFRVGNQVNMPLITH